MTGPSWAVLVMSYGSPESLEEMESYLLDIRGGRPTSPELVAEIRRRYGVIGGRSPLLDITRAQVRALEARLNAVAEEPRFRVYVGMRHWRPYIRDAVAHIAKDGFRHVVALCMAPHYSRMSVGAYFEKIREAQEEQGLNLDVTYVESWHTHPLFIQAIVDKVNAALDRFPIESDDPVRIVFTAHSLPTSIVAQGDPYVEQLRETARLVADQLKLSPDEWEFCFQSAGASPIPWLGPQLKDVVVERARAGYRRILVVPIGFVADHVEILYDIDVEARGLAEQAGARLQRTESMNATPRFIEALANVVEKAISRP